MTLPAQDTDVPATSVHAAAQETDAWWGSYSGWTMLPSLTVSIVLTALATWWAWTYVDREWVRVAILSLFVAIWLVESWRWCYRFFGINYRLTTRRIIKTRGWRRRIWDWPLERIASVAVRRTWWEKWAGVGRLLIHQDGAGVRPLILDGVRQPFHVAEKIRTLARQARAGPVA
jgi:hypothetical protein